MLCKKSGEIEWLEFELLQGIPHLKAGVFLRHGGISQGPYASLNLGGKHGSYLILKKCRKLSQTLQQKIKCVQ